SLINLGAGKRQIVHDGKLEKQYQITVPEQFISSE
ncbi:MAG: type IV toxin-antitoxin system AbiEi family antitoxin domain-containing protein, partial [Legionella longbeachae]|nr:type IV toxin-antitoxin system AbiEi family antitoxin domain-containing protein [Legionella longbeachae]